MSVNYNSTIIPRYPKKTPQFYFINNITTIGLKVFLGCFILFFVLFYFFSDLLQSMNLSPFTLVLVTLLVSIAISSIITWVGMMFYTSYDIPYFIELSDHIVKIDSDFQDKLRSIIDDNYDSSKIQNILKSKKSNHIIYYEVVSPNTIAMIAPQKFIQRISRLLSIDIYSLTNPIPVLEERSRIITKLFVLMV